MTLELCISTVMNENPRVAVLGDDQETTLARMRAAQVRQMPILDAAGFLVGLETLDELQEAQARENPVIIMAGGLGKRLTPLTENCPKPMLLVGGKPILETILLSFLGHGFRHFYISVNHRAEMIKEYFGDGSRWGASIEYLSEDRSLGTAGALSLLPVKPIVPMIVTNGDILTKANFDHLLQFHVEHKSRATMCVCEYEYQVPYGVIRLNGHQILEIQEKPRQKFLVNAGIYALDPDVLGLVVADEHIDMTTLIERVARENWETAVFPLREYWMDIGRHADLDRANAEFNLQFKESDGNASSI